MAYLWGVFEHGAWCVEGWSTIFFTNLFSIDSQVVKNYIMENQPSTISKEDRATLVTRVSIEKFHQEVMAMHSFKAPSADGFQAFFYK